MFYVIYATRRMTMTERASTMTAWPGAKPNHARRGSGAFCVMNSAVQRRPHFASGSRNSMDS